MRPVFLFAKQMYILIQRIINISVLDKLLSGFMKIKWESFEFSSSTGKHMIMTIYLTMGMSLLKHMFTP